eukprot:9493572-Pyramimonas_sp.AAC.2
MPLCSATAPSVAEDGLGALSVGEGVEEEEEDGGLSGPSSPWAGPAKAEPGAQLRQDTAAASWSCTRSGTDPHSELESGARVDALDSSCGRATRTTGRPPSGRAACRSC